MVYGSDSSHHTLDDTVRKTLRGLRKHSAEFDTIAVRGVSGLIVGAPVSLILKKELAVVRKSEDDSHDGTNPVNYSALKRRCLFLDDFIASGNTRYAVEAEVKQSGGELVAQFLYQYDEGRYERL